MHFEEVMCSSSNENPELEIEYMAEDEEAVLGSSKDSFTEKSNPEPIIAQPVKRKIPIIRRPGEIVTPVRVQLGPTNQLSNLQVSSSSSSNHNQISMPRPIITARIIPEWRKVEAPRKTLMPTPKASNQVLLSLKPNPLCTLTGNKSDTMTALQHDTQQLDRIEQKMDEILNRLERHEAKFRQMQSNITDLKVELKTSVQDLKDLYEKRAVSSQPRMSEGVPVKRKRLVTFPFADDNYLLRIEQLLDSDEEIQDDLNALFKEAPSKSVYDFLRFNINSLFKNCSKYTWTGKPSNSCPTATPCNSAHNLSLVAHLMTCTQEVFPYASRDAISKDFRRALDNFNDAMKRRKQAEKLHLQNSKAELSEVEDE